MKLRTSYMWFRESEAVYNPKQYDFQIDHHAPEIRTISQLKGYLRDFAKEFTGKGVIEIVSVSDSFENKVIDSLSEKIHGQVIEFNNGKAVFKRNKAVFKRVIVEV